MKNTMLFFFLLFSLTLACTYVQPIKDGLTAFDRKQYKKAIPMLKADYKKAKSKADKAEFAFRVGESYKLTNESDNAIEWYRTAYEDGYGIDALLEHAQALKRTQQYKAAIAAFKELGLEIGSPYEYKREIQGCEIALKWLEEGAYEEYTVNRAKFNSGALDYSPSVYEGNALVFASDRKASTGEEAYNWTGRDFMDLFLVDLNTNEISNFDNPINSVHNEGPATFSRDYKEMIFTRCFGDENNIAYCKLMSSTKEGESWSPPKVLSFIEPEINYMHPSLSEDGSTLYFSANHPDGWGEYDIYAVDRIEGEWDEPRLLGRTVNTIGNERFPYIDKDTLYFSSDFHAGMGGLDVFRTYKYKNNDWTPVINLKAPINSGADDFGYIVDYRAPIIEPKVIHKGYFTSTRADSKGQDDIYAFTRMVPPPPPPPPPKDTTTIVKEIEYTMLLKGYVLEKIYEDPNNPNSKVLGRKPLNEAGVIISVGEENERIRVGEDGLFEIIMEEETVYKFIASKEGYLNNNAKFSTKNIAKDPEHPNQEFLVEIELDKIFKNKEIVLDNIYYDYNESYIRGDAKPTLNELADILVQNPSINIELASHTDCRGKINYNQKLSQQRAQAAVDYLISIGVAPNRMTAKGYGKEALLINCECNNCTEDEHQANRRTTFKIVG